MDYAYLKNKSKLTTNNLWKMKKKKWNEKNKIIWAAPLVWSLGGLKSPLV